MEFNRGKEVLFDQGTNYVTAEEPYLNLLVELYLQLSEEGIGMAYTDLDINEPVTVKVRGNNLNGRVVRMPFL